MENFIATETHMFRTLNGALQFFYLFYLISGVLLPFGYLRQIRRYRDGALGIGDTCIRSLTWMACCRIPPLVYSCTVIWSLPMFLATAVDIGGRVWVIFEARNARCRSIAWIASQHASSSGESVPVQSTSLSALWCGSQQS